MNVAVVVEIGNFVFVG